jgi:LPS O-antigen subunit length determinant protein (WzzB/FepE family)
MAKRKRTNNDLQNIHIKLKTDIKSEYINKTTRKSSWTPIEGRNRWLDQYIQEVKNDVIKNFKTRF